MDNLEEKISKIDKKLNTILELLNTDLKKNCEKMGNHIDFVETVYDKIRNPLNFMCNRVNEYSGNDPKILQLEDKENISIKEEKISLKDNYTEINNNNRINWYMLGSSIFIGCLVYKYYK